MDALGKMRTPVNRNHASLVDHLVINHDETRALDNLVASAVPTWKDSCGHTARDAPLPRCVVLPRVGEMCKRGVLSCRGFRPDRNPAAFRLDNHGLSSSIS